MFGNRPYSKYFELCVPGELFSDWATCFQDHELSLRMAKAGVYQHIQSGSNRVVDKGAIDKENVTVENSERIIGTKLKLTILNNSRYSTAFGDNKTNAVKRNDYSRAFSEGTFGIYR